MSVNTDPVVESLWVVPGEDGAGQVQSSEGRAEVWMIVKRTINGTTRRYVEVMERDFSHGDDQRDAYYSDSLLTFDHKMTVADITVSSQGNKELRQDGDEELREDGDAELRE